MVIGRRARRLRLLAVLRRRRRQPGPAAARRHRARPDRRLGRRRRWRPLPEGRAGRASCASGSSATSTSAGPRPTGCSSGSEAAPRRTIPAPISRERPPPPLRARRPRRDGHPQPSGGRNALSGEMLVRMHDAWVEIDEDPEIRVAIVTGAGGHFCAGADLKAMAAGHPDDEWTPRFNADPRSALARRCCGTSSRGKPLIAAVEGYAVAGGTEILQAMDLRVAGEGAIFGVAEVRRGLFPLGGSTVRLRRQIPYTVAAELLLDRPPDDGDGGQGGRPHRARRARRAGARPRPGSWPTRSPPTGRSPSRPSCGASARAPTSPRPRPSPTSSSSAGPCSAATTPRRALGPSPRSGSPTSPAPDPSRAPRRNAVADAHRCWRASAADGHRSLEGPRASTPPTRIARRRSGASCSGWRWSCTTTATPRCEGHPGADDLGQRGPEPRTVKQRVHLDIETPSLEPVLALGATVKVPASESGFGVGPAPRSGGRRAVRLRPGRRADAALTRWASTRSTPTRLPGWPRWWADAIGGEVARRRARLLLARGRPRAAVRLDRLRPVPEPKTVKNRIHWDITSDDLDGILARGATVLAERPRLGGTSSPTRRATSSASSALTSPSFAAPSSAMRASAPQTGGSALAATDALQLEVVLEALACRTRGRCRWP